MENKNNTTEDNIFISDYFDLNEELEEIGVFNSIINKDSPFFINIIRLKDAVTPEFKNSYERVNNYFSEIMLLLDASERKGDKFYNTALERFTFHGHKGINLGVSSTGIDAGFGKKLSQKVISDAFEIVKKGSKHPEIFHLVGLFEENVGSDRLSDMIATIIEPDIVSYTKRINKELNINPENYTDIEFHNGIAMNQYKHCELLYVPIEILHEIPIAKCWGDIDYAVAENKAIRDQMNKVIGQEWKKMNTGQKKAYIREYFFQNADRCDKLISEYMSEDNTLDMYNPKENVEYFIAHTHRKIRKSNTLNCLFHSDNYNPSSYDAANHILLLFKEWMEENHGWDVSLQSDTRRREKVIQRLVHLCGKDFCNNNNIDMSFESNGGHGPTDLKVSRGSDKTVIEIKLSSNSSYMHGYEVQIEEYAKAEGAENKIYVFVIVDDDDEYKVKKLEDKYDERIKKGDNPAKLIFIDSRQQKSASVS